MPWDNIRSLESTTTASNGGRAPTTNAWARPLQPKTTPNPPPGMGTPKTSTTSTGSAALGTPMAGTSTPSNNGMSTILRERFLHLSLALVGQKVQVTQINGAVMEGVLHTFTPFPRLSPDMKNMYVLKAVKTVKPPKTTEGDSAASVPKDGSTVIIPVNKVLYLHAKSVDLRRTASNGSAGFTPTNKTKADLRTDTEISAGFSGRNRELVAAGSAWTTASAAGKTRLEALAGSLEEKRKGFGTAAGTGLSGSIGQWDQFKANQELFNVSASFDENLYTTALDKSQIDAKKIAEAERIAREIENTTSSNLHVAEERGQLVETDYDEEDRYSGVLTKEGKVRHRDPSPKEKEKVMSAPVKADQATRANEPKPASIPPPKKMNYAAAVAKADSANKNAVPPGFGTKAPPVSVTKPAKISTPESKTKDSTEAVKVTPDEKEESEKDDLESAARVQLSEETKVESKSEEEVAPVLNAAGEAPSEEKSESKAEAATSSEENFTVDTEKAETKENPADKELGEAEAKTTDETSTDTKKEETKEAPKSKLNANAKEFTFNPAAKSFTPSFSPMPAAALPEYQHQPLVDPNVGMHMQPGAHPMHTPHYMQPGPMGQPGMFVVMLSISSSTCLH